MGFRPLPTQQFAPSGADSRVDLEAADSLIFADYWISHGVVAGDDNLLAVGNFLRGVTSGAYGVILGRRDAKRDHDRAGRRRYRRLLCFR
jgi:hypothetical protein